MHRDGNPVCLHLKQIDPSEQKTLANLPWIVEPGQEAKRGINTKYETTIFWYKTVPPSLLCLARQAVTAQPFLYGNVSIQQRGRLHCMSGLVTNKKGWQSFLVMFFFLQHWQKNDTIWRLLKLQSTRGVRNLIFHAVLPCDAATVLSLISYFRILLFKKWKNKRSLN